MNPNLNLNLNLPATMNWLYVPFVLGGALLLGGGLSLVLFVSSVARAADSFVAMFRAPLPLRNVPPLKPSPL